MELKLAGKGVMVKPTKPRPDFPLFVHQFGGNFLQYRRGLHEVPGFASIKGPAA